MKNKLLRKLFALTLTLLFALMVAACTPEVHIHTGGESSKDLALVSTEEATQPDGSQSKTEISVASSEEAKPKDNMQNKVDASVSSKEKEPTDTSQSKQNNPVSSKEAKPTNNTQSKVDTTVSSKETKPSDNVESKVDTTVSSKEKGTTDKFESKADIPDASSEKQNSSTSTQDKSEPVTSQATSSVVPNSAKISKSAAKEIALKDAGLKAADITEYEIELDHEKGVLYYEISFEYKNQDYDYDINAKTGKIISVDKPNATSDEAKISKAEAKNIALNHAGVKAADITNYEIELEKDNGVWKYEISFRKGNIEYDYTINAQTGKILESEKDIDD